MLAIELYQTLNNEGVQLWTEGEKLRFAPKEKITPFLLAELKAIKNELLSLLAANDHYEKFVVEKSYPQTEDGQHYPKSVVKKSHATNELLTHYEKPLFYHLLACSYCHVLRGEYCASGYAMGSVYDALLLNRDDAQARREDLALRIDRACISGRSVFVPFSRIDAPPPPNTALQTRKYGNTHEYEAFINHWTACEVCKPNLGRYCSEGQKLKEVARA